MIYDMEREILVVDIHLPMRTGGSIQWTEKTGGIR